MKKKEKKERNFIEINKGNIDFLKRICSKSGYSWHELYYVNANKYFTCLQIREYPEETWGGFMNDVIDMTDVLLTCDVSNLAYMEYEDRFEKIIGKHEDEKFDASNANKFRKFKRASKAIQSINTFDNYIDATGDAIKEVSMRIYMFGKTHEELQNKLDKVMNVLDAKNIRGFIQTNNLADDVKALTMLDNPVRTMMPSKAVAELMKQSSINRVDDGAGLIGYTANGKYAPDIFSVGNYSYNTIDIGGTGAGKSSLRKKFEKLMILCGNHKEFLFDIHEEYDEYCKVLKIPRVSINENNNVNIMQLFHVYNKEEDDIIRENDIQTQKSLVLGRFRSVTGFKAPSTMIKLNNILNDFYIPYLKKSLKSLSNDDWGTLGEVLALVNAIDTKHMVDKEQEDIYYIKEGLQLMCESYGYLFNRKTNMDFDLTHSICFDLSFLRENDDKKVLSSYVSLLMNYVSYGMFLNLEENQKLMKEKGLKIYDLKRPLKTMRIVIDETAKYIDDDFLTDVLAGIKFARKASAGFGFIFHSLADIKKAVSNESDKRLSELFELCTNKYIGIVDGETLRELPDYVRGLTEQDMNVIGSFEKGPNDERTFLAIDDQKRKTVFTSIITRREREYFKGGL